MKYGQEEFSASKVNLLLLFLLSGSSIKLHTNSYLSTYRSVQLSSLVVNHQWIGTDIKTWKCSKSMLNHKRFICITSLPWVFTQGPPQKRDLKMLKARYHAGLEQNHQKVHSSYRYWQRASWDQVSEHWSMDREGVHDLWLLTEELGTVNVFWGRKSQLSLRRWLLACWPHSSGWLNTQGCVDSTNAVSGY